MSFDLSSHTDRLVMADRLEEAGDPLGPMVRLLDAFVLLAQSRIDESWRRNGYTFAPPPAVTVTDGPTYWRLVKHDRKADGTPSEQRSVYCFVRKADGAVLKAAGWKAPALRGRRCYLSDEAPTLAAWLTPSGLASVR